MFIAENDFECSIKLSIWKNQSERERKTQGDEQDECKRQVTKFLPKLRITVCAICYIPYSLEEIMRTAIPCESVNDNLVV